ncbi:hypothetical protein TMatcc_007669 [Talaromyces marneffei ATCC 18224]
MKSLGQDASDGPPAIDDECQLNHRRRLTHKVSLYRYNGAYTQPINHPPIRHGPIGIEARSEQDT